MVREFIFNNGIINPLPSEDAYKKFLASGVRLESARAEARKLSQALERLNLGLSLRPSGYLRLPLTSQNAFERDICAIERGKTEDGWDDEIDEIDRRSGHMHDLRLWIKTDPGSLSEEVKFPFRDGRMVEFRRYPQHQEGNPRVIKRLLGGALFRLINIENNKLVYFEGLPGKKANSPVSVGYVFDHSGKFAKVAQYEFPELVLVAVEEIAASDFEIAGITIRSLTELLIDDRYFIV